MAVSDVETAITNALTSIKTEFKTATDQMKELVVKQAEEIAQHGGTMSETKKAIENLEASMKQLGTDYASIKSQFEEVLIKSGRRIGSGDMKAEDYMSLGERLAESAEYKAWRENGSQGNSKNLKLKSLWPGDRVKAMMSMEKKAITGFGDLRTLFSLERLLQIIAQPLEQKRVRDLLTVIPTSNSSVEWIRETGYTNRAGVQVEAGTKPESDLVFELLTTSCKTIAHHTPIPRQVAEDVPALMAYLDARLYEGLKVKEDAEILSGDGTGAHLQGLLTDPGVQTYQESVNGRPKDTKIDTLRRCATLIRLAQYTATGIILNPIDWEEIELMKDSQERYIWVNVQVGGTPRLWRMDVVDTTSIAQGDFLVGALMMATILWDREDANMRIADQHDQDFIKNMLRILVEERLALTTTRPEALVSGQFDGPPLS